MKNKTINFLKDIFDIRDGKEHDEKTLESIRRGVSFRGANLWTLIFAVFIASIGLNINSIPIIIGAMLISPLMGPIVGLGLSLGIHDSILLKKSIRNLLIATVISIIISTIYFLVSPITNIQSELLARTSPTIYDVLIALFGGLAGVLASTRTEKNSVIPGVAIATALMPPLCTVGYGIATGEPKFFLGALYLYAINCIFICVATFLGVKYLKLPHQEHVDTKKSNQMRNIIMIVVIIMIVPATYFAYVFVKENNFNQNVDRYIRESFIDEGYAIIYKKINYKSSPHTIELAFLSKHFSDKEITGLEDMLLKYNLTDTKLVIKQDNASLSADEWNSVINNLKDESEKLKAIEAKLAGGVVGLGATEQILTEAQSINNKVVRMAIGDLSVLVKKESTTPEKETKDTKSTVAIFYYSKTTWGFSTKEQEVLTAWIKSRMQSKDTLTYFLPE